MAIKKNGRVRGKIGNTIHYQLNGQDIIKIRPAHVYNPKTTKQVAQRLRIKTASRFVTSVHEFIKIGYQATSLDYPANEARQYLMKNCFVDNADGPILDYSKVKVSRGLLKQPIDCTFTLDGDQLLINWKKPTTGEKNGDEKVMVTMYWEELIDKKTYGHSKLVNNGVRRHEGTIILPIPIHDAPINFWLFFYNPEGAVGESLKKVSDSVWVGALGLS